MNDLKSVQCKMQKPKTTPMDVHAKRNSKNKNSNSKNKNYNFKIIKNNKEDEKKTTRNRRI